MHDSIVVYAQSVVTRHREIGWTSSMSSPMSPDELTPSNHVCRLPSSYKSERSNNDVKDDPDAQTTFSRLAPGCRYKVDKIGGTLFDGEDVLIVDAAGGIDVSCLCEDIRFVGDIDSVDHTVTICLLDEVGYVGSHSDIDLTPLIHLDQIELSGIPLGGSYIDQR